jgi:predicted metal-dependent HD superfamily phosphohydrolase
LSLEKEVEKLYSADLPYHNFQHALDAIGAAEIIVGRCQAEGITVDHQVVYYALLFHDAGFQDDHLALGFDTKESYAADLAARALEQRGVPSGTIDKVVAAILGTHKDGKFVTAEQKSVRAADLSSLAADYATFKQNSADLKAEYELFNRKQLSWREWVEHASHTIRFYLSQEIGLTSYFTNESGESAFHQAVRENLERLLSEA